jgi:hypothetical protein
LSNRYDMTSVNKSSSFSSPNGTRPRAPPQRSMTTNSRYMSMSRDEGKGGRTIEKFNRLIQFFAQTENVEDLDRRRDGLEHAAKIVDQAWDLNQANWAVQFAKKLREEEILDLALDSLDLQNPPDLLQESLRLIASTIFLPENRKIICRQACLEPIVNTFKRYVDHKDGSFRASCLEILASCVKESDEVIARLIRMGVFETVKKALERINEEPVARFSALFFSFASLASNVKHPIHQKMLDNQLVNALEIIQASECEYAVFHASLALAVLQTNKEIKPQITFQTPLADHFIAQNHAFEKCERFRLDNSRRTAFGTAPPILDRINPLLYCDSGTVQAIGAYFLLQEVLARQSNKQFDVFSETNNIAALKKCAATTQNGFARELASNALRLMNQTVPVKLSNQVHFWDTEDVAIWFEINGFKDFSQIGMDSCCDGRMLLLITEEDLVTVFQMSNKFHRRKFIHDLTELRIRADYSSEDASNIAAWLAGISREFRQYSFNLIQAGVDLKFLPHLTDQHLKSDCQISNGVHRTKILEAIVNEQSGRHSNEDPVPESKKIFQTFQLFLNSTLILDKVFKNFHPVANQPEKGLFAFFPLGGVVARLKKLYIRSIYFV